MKMRTGFAVGICVLCLSNTALAQSNFPNGITGNGAFSWSDGSDGVGSHFAQMGINQDVATLDIDRTVNQSGGTTGYVNNALRAYTVVSGTSNNYEWAATLRIDNSSTGNNNQVAGYMQGRCEVAGCSPTWGGDSEARDDSGQANPSHGLIGHEFDVNANGSDNNSTRVVGDFYCGQATTNAGTATTCGHGVRVGVNGNARYGNELELNGAANAAITVNSSSDTYGLQFLGSYSGPALDFTGASLGSNAIRLASGQYVALEATSVYRMGFDPSCGSYNSVAVEAFCAGSAESLGLRMDAGSAGLRLGAKNVVGQGSSYAMNYTGSGFVMQQPVNFTSSISANGAAAVSCAAASVNLSTFAVTNGIVTHC